MASALSLTEFLRLYVRTHLGLSEGAAAQLTIAVRVLERWSGRRVSVAELSAPLIQSFLAAYLQDHSPATTNSKRRALLSLWRAAYELRLCATNPDEPCQNVRSIPEYLRSPEAWSVEELGRILAAARMQTAYIAGFPAGAWWESLLLAMYDTGERIGAIRQTRTIDVVLANGAATLFIPAERRKDRRARWYQLSQQTTAVCHELPNDGRELMWPWPFCREWLDKRFKLILCTARVRFGRGQGGLWHKLRRTSGSLIEAAGGDGSKHLGNSRAVFEKFYRDPRICGGSQVNLLPRPTF